MLHILNKTFRRVDQSASYPVRDLTDRELVCRRVVLLPYVIVFGTSRQPWHSDRYQARRRRILPTIASSLLNPDGGHSD